MNDELNLRMLQLLHDSVIEECGDAIWLSKLTTLFQLTKLIKTFETDFELKEYDGYVTWGRDGEYVTITNSEQIFDSKSKYVTLKLIY